MYIVRQLYQPARYNSGAVWSAMRNEELLVQTCASSSQGFLRKNRCEILWAMWWPSWRNMSAATVPTTHLSTEAAMRRSASYKMFMHNRMPIAHLWSFRHLRWPKESCDFFWYVAYFCEEFVLTRQLIGVSSQWRSPGHGPVLHRGKNLTFCDSLPVC